MFVIYTRAQNARYNYRFAVTSSSRFVLFRHYVQGWCRRAFWWSHHVLLDHEFKFLLYLFKSIRCETVGFVVDWWARCGFDVVYHTVSSPLFSKNRWACEVRKFCQKLAVWWFADNGLNGYFVCRGDVSPRWRLGCRVDEAFVSRVHEQPVMA